jgi:hypothetical protein
MLRQHLTAEHVVHHLTFTPNNKFTGAPANIFKF